MKSYRFLIAFLFATLSVNLVGCSSEDSAQTQTQKSSAIDVKNPSQTLALKPLRSDTHQVALTVADVYATKKSHVFIEDTGQVVKLLADDNKGSRHQKFLVKTERGQTLLFAHNIDIAARIDTIQIGDNLSFRGEYVYNPKGGVIHWTHHDPKNQQSGGWIKHQGRQYD